MKITTTIIFFIFLLFGCNNSKIITSEIMTWSELEVYNEHLKLQCDSLKSNIPKNDIVSKIDDTYRFIETIKLKLLESACKDCIDVLEVNRKTLFNTGIVNELLLGSNKDGLAYILNVKMKELRSIILVNTDISTLLEEHIYFYLDTSPPPPFDDSEILSWTNIFENLQLLSSINYLTIRQIYLLQLRILILDSL